MSSPVSRCMRIDARNRFIRSVSCPEERSMRHRSFRERMIFHHGFGWVFCAPSSMMGEIARLDVER